VLIKGGKQMYAIIEVGGKQHVVKKGDNILVEKQEVSEGKVISLDKVLLCCDDDLIEVGQPYLKNALVEAQVLEQTKSEKTIAYKYRRRKASHTKKGHRQQLTRLEIKEIKIG
jgi:large subunit ribosomal protein L21